ncbi:hypothetical protein ACLOJK_015263, partial [Asimina triloba]
SNDTHQDRPVQPFLPQIVDRRFRQLDPPRAGQQEDQHRIRAAPKSAFVRSKDSKPAAIRPSRESSSPAIGVSSTTGRQRRARSGQSFLPADAMAQTKQQTTPNGIVFQ